MNIATLPDRMKALPTDERGYPVPWFVAWRESCSFHGQAHGLGCPLPTCVITSRPEFRAMDEKKWVAAIKRKLCWVCGERLGVNVVFVAGPMCGINRTSSEPPSHAECAVWSAVNCPFLSNPHMVRREDELINNANLREASAGMAITRNPGVSMLWYTRQFEVFDAGGGKPLIQMGEPERVDWYAEGKIATREQVVNSILGGLPALEAVARSESGGIVALKQYIERFEKWVPGGRFIE